MSNQGQASASTSTPLEAEVCVVGSIILDLVAYSSRLPLVGETIIGDSFTKSFGGKGANQAVQSAMLGVSVAVCGKLGNDEFAKEYRDNFIKHGIDTTFITNSTDASTGVACISVDASGRNTIVVIPSANAQLTVDEVTASAHKIATAKVLLCQNEIPLAATLAAIKLASEARTITIFNPAPAAPLSQLSEVIALSDIVCPNETELAVLTGLKTDSLSEIELAAKELRRLGGCKIVLVTLGVRGAMVVAGETVTVVPLDEESAQVKAVDTVGAGDSFLGTFASHLARGQQLQAAVGAAIRCASLSVTRKGAQISYFQLHEVPDVAKPPPLHNNNNNNNNNSESSSSLITKESLRNVLFG